MSLILTIIWTIITLIIAGGFILPSYPHKNIVLETTIPLENLQDINIKKITHEYRKKVLTFTIFFILYGILIYKSEYDFITFLLFVIGLIIELIYIYLTELRFIRKMTALKQYFHWKTTSSNITLTKPVDLKEISTKKIPSPILYLIAIVIIAFEFSYALYASFSNVPLLIVASITFFIVAIFIWSATSIRKSPIKKLTSDQDINTTITHNNKLYWITSLTHGAIISSFIPLPLIFFYQAPYSVTVISVIVLLVVSFIWLFLFINNIIKSKCLEDYLLSSTDLEFEEDDYHWRYILYNNPKDSHLLVKNRLSTQTSLNMSRSTGKMTLLSSFAAIAIILTTLFVTLLTSEISNSSPQIHLSKNNLELTALLTETSDIKYKDIKNTELINNLPASTHKIAGLNTTHSKTGSFKINDKKSLLYVQRNKNMNNKIIKITTKKKTYYFSNKNTNINNIYKRIIAHEK